MVIAKDKIIVELYIQYSGTCLNRPAMGPATYGLFIQVVSLCKFEILNQFSIGQLGYMYCVVIGARLMICTSFKTYEPTNVNHIRLIKGFLKKVSP